jgi:hypothetical protein
MSKSIEKIDLSAAFTQKELFNELFRQNLMLQAHIQALHGMVAVLWAKVYQQTDKEATDLILDKINECAKGISKSNEFLIKVRRANS